MMNMKKRIRAAVFLISVLLLAGGVGVLWLIPWWTCSQHWRQAEQALARGDYDLARGHIGHCVQARPKNAEYPFALARACRLADDLAAWRHFLAQSRRLGYTADVLDREENLCRVQVGAFGSVEKSLLELLVARDPDEGPIFEALSRGYLRSYRLRDAVRAATLWQERYPNDWRPFWYRSQAFELHGVEEDAILGYRTVLELQPEQRHARLALAGLLFDQCHFGDALEQFKKVFPLDPGNTTALFGTASCYHSLGEAGAALTALNALLEKDSQHAGALVLRGQVEMGEQRPAEALTWFQRGQQLNPHAWKANLALAQCLRFLGKDKDAVPYQLTYERLKNERKRLTGVIKQLGARPEDISLRLEAAAICHELGLESEWLRWLQSAVHMDPEHLPARRALVECLGRVGALGPREAIRGVAPAGT
jgi:tetratricopeptide (TPR) repeat protein